MPDKILKIIIDTNLWVSWLLNRKQFLLSALLLHEAIDILSSSTLEDELFEVLERPKFSKRLSQEQILNFRDDFKFAVSHVDVHSVVNACKDPKDDFLLALAMDGDADFLLTGDADLLALGTFGKTQILTIRAFTEKISNF